MYYKEIDLRRTMMIMAILLWGMSILHAQISSYYSFSASTETYAAISGTAVPTAIGDNVISNPVDIGFTFNYGLNTYTQVKISSNGYVTLGTAPGSSSNNSLASTVCPILAPLWDDTYLQGSAQCLLSGNAPNRVFTIQFSGVKWATNTTTIFNYQVRMHEDRTIEFIYGPSVGVPTNASASIGINMLPGGGSNYISVTPGNPATSSTSQENNTIATWPGTNTKYSFNTSDIYQNELAAISLSGNQTPTAGVSNTYTVRIRNNGSETQNNYIVKLLSGTTVLASAAGLSIAPQAIAEVAVPWTPSTPGSRAIFGKVELTGDENATNDYTDPMNIIVQEPGTTAVTIGDGSQSARKPIDVSYLNSVFQMIIPASEIALNGSITGISFYNNFVENRPNIATKIWLGSTTQTNLSAGWIPAYQMVQVYNGNVNYPNGQNIIYIPFNPATPFSYNGGNLVVMVSRPMDTNFYSSSNQFLCQTVGTNRARNVYSDATVYDPNNMGTVGTVSGQFPKTTLYIIPGVQEPEFSISPASHNFGNVALNNSVTQTFVVFNSGGGTLTLSSATINGSPYFSLQGLPNLPVSLTSGQSTSFNVQYSPAVVGNHSATISVTDDLSRLIHTVNVSGNGIDPTITAIPYLENFDNVSVPNLPFGWQKLTWGSGTVATVATTSHSAANSILLNNSNSSTGPYLILPPLSTTYPVNLHKLVFWAKGASGFSIQVGVISNPLNADTFTGIQNLTLSNDWTAYQVDLRTYSGSGTQIAFKHNQGGNNRSIYIDDIQIEALLQNDLAAIQVTGETTPNAGTTYNYTISVKNPGLNVQQDYQVKLFKAPAIELGTAAGPVIPGNGQATVTIPWTPAAMENASIYARIFLGGDQNATNDQTPNLNVTVQESATTLVVVGSGNIYSHEAPVDMYANCSLFETIYTPDELGVSGLISIVNFYNFFTSNIPPKPTRIWMGMTSLPDLSAGWISANELALVFDGLVSYPSGVNTIPIVLQQPFTLLQGQNLVMLVERSLDTSVYSFWDNFACQNHPVNRARRASSSVGLDPYNPPAGTYTTLYPKTGFYLTPGGAGNIMGTVTGLNNQPLAGATVQLQNGPNTTTDMNGYYSFQNIFARDYMVTVTAHGYNDFVQYATLQTDSTVVLDFAMTPMATVSVSGSIRKSDDPAIGLSGAQITISGYEDYQGLTDIEGNFTITGVYANHIYEYQASAQGYQSIAGTLPVESVDILMENIILPENTYSPNNVVASITNNSSAVDVLWLSPNATMPLRELVGFQVWRLLQGQEQSEELWVHLTPETIVTQRYTDTSWNGLPVGTYKWAVKSVYTNNLFSAAEISNPLQSTGTLTGFIRNAQQEPIMGATISAGTATTVSAANGSYTLHIPSGIYNVTCNLAGHYNNTQYNVEVIAGQTTQLDFILVPVANEDDYLVASNALHDNYPNPFNPTTTISYDIKSSNHVLLEVYNLKGQLVRRLVNTTKAQGHHKVIWDGKDEHGDPVCSGIYQYRMTAGDYRKTQRMTLAK